MKANYKIVKRLFCLGYTYQKYHRSVRNVAMVLVAAVALGSSTYAWFVTNNKVGAAAMDSNTLAKIADTKGTEIEGTPAAAVASDYAVKNTFYVGTKGTNLTNLIVDNNTTGNIAIVDKSANSNANAEFDDALRILVTCGDNWVLCDKNSILGASNTE